MVDVANLRFEEWTPQTSGEVRFAVGEPEGVTSNSWKFWSSRKGDVYLACRDNYRELKVSLHVSGKWRMGFDETIIKQRPELLSPGENRAWEVWVEPPEILPEVKLAFQAWFLPEELAVTPEQRKTELWAKPVIYTATPPEGTVSIASIWVTQTNVRLSPEIGSGITLASLGLPNGRFAQLTVHIEPAGDTMRVELARRHQETMEKMKTEGVWIPPSGRLLFFGQSPNGCRFLTEMNVARN